MTKDLNVSFAAGQPPKVLGQQVNMSYVINDENITIDTKNFTIGPYFISIVKYIKD